MSRTALLPVVVLAFCVLPLSAGPLPGDDGAAAAAESGGTRGRGMLPVVKS